jgi:hypothetical protein
VSRQPIVDDASYLLLDSIGERLCAAWQLMPSTTNVGTQALTDYASVIAEYAQCSLEEAMSRIRALRAADILHDDGTIDDTVLAYLRRRGAIRIGKISEGDDE